MKILTILGTRPEIIRLSLIISKLDQFTDEHILVHTGQNFTASLSDVFFHELKVRKPNYILGKQQQSLGEQLATMFFNLEKIFEKEQPDKVLILGDTNSGLSALLAERMGISVVHMEAGNRCFDLAVPEEINRRLIDTVSSYNLPYTRQSKENLLRERIASNRIWLLGNPIYEVLEHYKEEISKSRSLEKLGLQSSDYFLVTIHRAENVDDPKQLAEIFKGINLVAKKFKRRIICSIHPRTKAKLAENSAIDFEPLVEFHEPFGFFDFVQLEKNAFCVLTDSGTVQEECCIFQVPTVTIRKTTERPETIECGSNMLSGINANSILQAVNVMITQKKGWSVPEGYVDLNVSNKVVKFLLGGVSIVR